MSDHSGVRLCIRSLVATVIFVSVSLGSAWFMVNVFPQRRDVEVLQSVLHELRSMRQEIIRGPIPWILFGLWTAAVAFVSYVLGMLKVSLTCMTYERKVTRAVIRQQVEETRRLRRARDVYCTIAHVRLASRLQNKAQEEINAKQG